MPRKAAKQAKTEEISVVEAVVVDKLKPVDTKLPKKLGRPRETFLTASQLKKMDRMAMDQCKHRTIAEALGVGREELRLNYLPRLLKKSALGRVELQADQRRMQSKQPSVAIFRGKNYLGQTDKQDYNIAGSLTVNIKN